VTLKFSDDGLLSTASSATAMKTPNPSSLTLAHQHQQDNKMPGPSPLALNGDGRQYEEKDVDRELEPSMPEPEALELARKRPFFSSFMLVATCTLAMVLNVRQLVCFHQRVHSLILCLIRLQALQRLLFLSQALVEILTLKKMGYNGLCLRTHYHR
jgi:hypothetical protein